MRKKWIKLLLVSVLIGLLVGCGGSAVNNQPDHIKAVVLPYTSFGPFFIAQEEGFFEEYGLDVEYVRMDSGTSPLALLEQGEIDVLGSGPSLGLFNALAGGSQIRVVADKGYLDQKGCTYMALLAPTIWAEANQDPTADALQGKRVSIDPINFEAFMFDQILENVGLTLDDVNVDDIAPPALPEAFKNDAVDIVSVGDPWITRILEDGSIGIWKPYQDIVPDMQFGFVLFGAGIQEKSNDAGARFLAALLRGVEQYGQGKTPRNLEIMAQYTDLDDENLKAACWPPMNPSGDINLNTVDQFQVWAVSKGLQDTFIPAEKYWDSSPLEKARELIK